MFDANGPEDQTTVDNGFINPENELTPLVDDTNDFDKIKLSKGLRIAHLNINGLHSKIDEVRVLVNRTKIDILAISESKLNSNISDGDIEIENYKLYLLDRDTNGGGVAIYVTLSLSSVDHPNKLSNKHFESLWIKVKLKKCKAIHLCVTYRTPSVKNPLNFTKDLCDYLRTCLLKLPKGAEVIFF